MKIFTAKQIYEADAFTIKKHKITSDILMERASEQIFNWLHKRMQGAQVKIHLFCGIGNNGGDGVALARQLWEHGYNIEVFIVNYSEKRSQDFLLNLERLKDRKIWPNFFNVDSEFPEIGKDDIIVDAIFGIGLNRTPDTWVIKLMQYLNNTGTFILSIDIPSGLFTDKLPKDDNAVVRGDFALSFQVPKLVFFLPETSKFCKQWEVLDIGLDQDFMDKSEAQFHIIEKEDVLPFYIPRAKFSHKGTFGHSLIIGGSYGKIGAVQLASKAALCVGSGLVTAYVPNCGYIPLQTALPEVMVLTDDEEKFISKIDYDINSSVVGIGIGLGKEKETAVAFKKFLKKYKGQLVVDADGLNILSKNKDLLKELPKQTILTPHPKELKRLIGGWKDDFDKLEKTIAFSKKYDCIVVIKGAHSIVIYNGKGNVNTTGNPGMATAGTGDVLTGVITGLLTQGYEPLKAAIFGVYLHGKAGDIAANNCGYEALTASHIINNIGNAYQSLFEVPKELEPESTNE